MASLKNTTQYSIPFGGDPKSGRKAKWYRKVSLKCFLFLLLFFLQKVDAQNTPLGSFTTLNAEYHFDSTWSVFADPEVRALSIYNRFYYYELKGGVTYTLNKYIAFSLGGGSYNTYRGGTEFENYHTRKDFRIWEQIKIKQPLSFLIIDHRVRIEEVLNKTFDINARYRLQAKIPLNNKKLSAKTFYTSVYDEVFFSSIIIHFSRNRVYGGFGYIFSKTTTLEGGWVLQSDYSNIFTRNKNYLYTSLGFNF